MREPEKSDGVRGAPAVVVRRHDRVHRRRERGGDSHGAGEVELATSSFDAREKRGHGGENKNPDRYVDEERPPPVDPFGDDASQEDTRCAASRCGGAPDAHRLTEVGRLCEQTQHKSHRGGRDQRCSKTLPGPRCHQHRVRPGKAGEERRCGQNNETDAEDAPRPEVICQPPAEQKQTTESDHVRVEDPLQARVAETECLLDVRQRDPDDRRVHDHEELRDAEQPEGPPASPIGCGKAHRSSPSCS